MTTAKTEVLLSYNMKMVIQQGDENLVEESTERIFPAWGDEKIFSQWERHFQLLGATPLRKTMNSQAYLG